MLRNLLLMMPLALAQQKDQPPPFVPPKVREPVERVEPDWQLVPGELPTGTSEKARKLWKKVCSATVVPSPKREEPVQAFDLAFNIMTSRGVQQNQFQASFRFLAPNYIRASMKSGVQHLRGPKGDFLLVRDEKPKPLVGSRENKQDIDQLNDCVAIAQNFIALSDPGSLRIARLSTFGQPAVPLPSDIDLEDVENLRWLEIESPDFRLVADMKAASRLYWVSLGVDSITGQIKYCMIDRERPRHLTPSMSFVALKNVNPLDGFRVPFQLLIYEVEEFEDTESGRRWLAFHRKPNIDLWIQPGGTLRASLTEKDFLPSS